jgi:CheY-like chemotaxis protein
VITVLAAGRGASSVSAGGASSERPSVEVMTAEDGEEVLDKLARNRRIDAVLLMPGAGASELAAAIREEDPAGPPIYAWGDGARIEGVRALSATSAEEAIAAIVGELAG